MSEAGRGGIIVTGASKGIGAAIARELAGRGFVVAGLSRAGTVPDTPAGAPDGELIGITCDITDERALTEAVTSFADRVAGRLAGLVNNAGVNLEAPSAQLPLETLRRSLELNVVAAFHASQLVYPYLRGRAGLIVHIGSFYDRLGVRGNLAYSATKAAQASMTRTLAVEWARDGIAVVNIAPGYVLTDLNREFFSNAKNLAAVERRIPLGRLTEAEEVARVVGMLFDAEASALTGTTIYMDGAQGISL
ncbi:MAG TPA: SDR family oxidoreductase [Dehalococcoidia bacterium]|nr:SDR family oxidoreductase [Dehalococcoidia bacterium]